MKNQISKIEQNIQDYECDAWKILCEYVDVVADKQLENFSPIEVLGAEKFAQIHTLPSSIEKLEHVKKVWLYGSALKRIPPEIGKMKSLAYFDPYTSYNLNWFPFEITYCKNLIESRVSTRALYGNYKYRNLFPSLKDNPVRYCNDAPNCSICAKVSDAHSFPQYWVTHRVGTDYMPLLVSCCSDECKSQIPEPHDGYVKFPHKGGSGVEQPKMSNSEYYEATSKYRKKQTSKPIVRSSRSKLLNVIWKIWER